MEQVLTIKIEVLDKEDKKELEPNDDRTYVSSYARFFNESCIGWNKDAEYNLNFLKIQQQHANEILKSRGYIFLNEVYDMLGIPRSKAGQVVGWIYDEKNPRGDNFVDFDLFNVRNENFINGYERSVLLDFNVDGMIMDVLT